MSDLTDLEENKNNREWRQRWKDATRQHIQRARTLSVFRSACCCGEGAPPASVIKEATAKVTAVVIDKSPCASTWTPLRQTIIFRGLTQVHWLSSFWAATTSMSQNEDRMVGGAVTYEQSIISPDQHTQKHSTVAPVRVLERGDAQYMYIVNEGWYLHPILVTFSKALRFILL